MAAPRQAYACDPAQSRGRQFEEPPSATRSAFRRDCDRVIHSTAFRRLKHKTQVFVFHEGDHYRTRLTHSLEVAQIARALARQLGLDEDLTETLALAHDLGHPPFGHAGERALNRCLTDFGGFDHNAQALRLVTALEHRYPDFNGLNLTWETLEGIVKHNGPLLDRDNPAAAARLPPGIAEFNRVYDLDLSSFPSLEAQLAAVADDIAYDAHDMDDGLRAGLFTIADLKAVPLLAGLIEQIAARYPGLATPRFRDELIRELISYLIGSVVTETRSRLAGAKPSSVDDVRRHAGALAAFSAAVAAEEATIKAFLRQHMYRHPRVMRVMDDAERVVGDLFAHYRAAPSDLPAKWLPARGREPEGDFARWICNYIAGMTDGYALTEHRRIFDSTPDLR